MSTSKRPEKESMYHQSVTHDSPEISDGRARPTAMRQARTDGTMAAKVTTERERHGVYAAQAPRRSVMKRKRGDIGLFHKFAKERRGRRTILVLDTAEQVGHDTGAHRHGGEHAEFDEEGQVADGDDRDHRNAV